MATDPKAPQECEFISAFDGTVQTYLADSPAGPAAGLVVYLHGATGHQDQGMTAGTYNDSFGFMRRWAALRGWAYACPEYRGDSWMNAAAEADVAQLVELLRRRARAPVFILFGASMGGTAALIYASRNPEKLDGVLALCPATDMAETYRHPLLKDGIAATYGGSPDERPEEYAARSSCLHADGLAGLPVYIAHGEADDILPASQVRGLVQELRRLASPLQYVEIPGGSHDAPAHPRYIEQGLEWLIGQISARRGS